MLNIGFDTFLGDLGRSEKNSEIKQPLASLSKMCRNQKVSNLLSSLNYVEYE